MDVSKEVNQIKSNTYDITYMWNIKYDTSGLIFGKKQTLWLPKGKVREGMDWDSRLVDANDYVVNGYSRATRSYCIAQETISSLL